MILLVALAAGCASTARQESFGEFVDSSVITTKIKTKLFDHPLTRGEGIKVVTYKGVVELKGEVSSRKVKREADQIARSVEGVRQVKNLLVIRAR